MPNNLTPYLGTIFRSILVLPLIWICRLSKRFDQKIHHYIQQFIDWDYERSKKVDAFHECTRSNLISALKGKSNYSNSENVLLKMIAESQVKKNVINSVCVCLLLFTFILLFI